MLLQSKAIFISKNREDVPELADFLREKEITLHAHSLIRFEEVQAAINEQFDVVFFGSPRAVSFFFSQHQLLPVVSVACAGEGTANALTARGVAPEFIGGNKKDIQVVAEDFKQWAGKRSVLFPISDKSLGTFSSVLPEPQRTEVIVYKTYPSGMQIPDCDIYVFSSPSNVTSFFASNTIPEGAVCVAWGQSTAKSLLQFKNNIEVLETPSVHSLISLLNKKGGFHLPSVI